MHLLEINSLSWCPVPVNVFEKKNTIKEYLLASGSKDRKITIWRAGTDGKCQFQWLAFKNHFTSFLWIKPTILLSSMPCGGLVSWEFSADFQCRTKRHYLGESPIF
ncbi:uncharacterized protein LOC106658900 [Trichogramma pretiosum]|uniref:uncharacterized protein LOC106658900 n=1 Tax=Trichogramma pretiosum TaxID=7493 RepID=UPI0006C97F98|nr:uncharacterized protein LOC106658900 [Trichogramma pretiosum]